MRQLHSIEALEARIAPAAVTATLVGTKLTVTGDGAANFVYLGTGSEGFSVATGAGSDLIFNGTNLGDAGTKDIHSLVTDVMVDLGAGDDNFECFNGSFAKNVTIKGGDGKDTIKTVYFHVGGTFTVDGGADDDTLMLEADLQVGKLAIDLGAGTNQLQFNNTHLAAEGDSTIKGSTGVDTITTSQSATFTFGGKLDIALGGGDDSIGFGQSAITPPDLFEVGGKFSIVQGPHTGTFTVNFNSAIFRVGGDFSITTDGKTGGTNNVLIGSGNVNVLGKTTFKSTGEAVDTYDFSGGQLQLAGAVSVDLGEAKNTLTFTSVLGTTLGALAYKGGAGDDKVSFVSNSPITVVGLTDVKLGDGTNEFREAYENNTAQSLTLAGGLAVTGGKGADTVSLQVFDGSIGGKGAKLTLGDGTNTATLTANYSLGLYGSLTATGGAGDTTVMLGARFVNVRGSVSATFGAGKGTLDLQGSRMDVAGGLKFTATGAGDDHLNLAGNILTIKGATTVKGDAGAMNVDVTADYPFDFGSVSITTKAGGGTTKIFGGGNINGKFTYSGGTGANTVDLGRESGYPFLYLHDAVSITSAAATGTESLKMHHVVALAAVTTKLGAAANTVTIDDTIFLGAVSLDTGDGADTVNFSRTPGLSGSVAFYGSVKILTGAGADTVNLGDPANINFFVPVASTLIDGGADTDTVNNNRVYDGMTIFTPTEKNFETVAP